MDLFWLYRPTAPSVRAQSIQVVHMAHAMASRGHRVTLAVDPAEPTSAADVLAFYGLGPVRGLDLFVLPASRTAGSIAWRALLAGWVVRTRGGGVLYARSKRHAQEAVRLYGDRFRLVIEAHEVDSLQAAERGEDPGPARALEAFVLARAAAVVTNAPGTLALLREAHPDLPPALAAHNATHPSRIRRGGPGEGVGYVGSARSYKDLATLAAAARELPWPVHAVGSEAPGLVAEPALPHRDVPDRLAGFRVLVLPLAKGLFGERLTSPLKLWDYLASGVPIVGADLPSLHDAAPGAFHPYRPGDPADLARAIRELYADEALRAEILAHARVRTWDDRAAEVEAFLAGLP